jgi:hypothetical protein
VNRSEPVIRKSVVQAHGSEVVHLKYSVQVQTRKNLVVRFKSLFNTSGKGGGGQQRARMSVLL